ncbi:RagB/SusD family nutrient uptake outer membrane protein [candidate division KSB1 bacterium]|nr:RagB/SusD family nutrient uptake outer membrane protein [candidate division KSB1 bacterium]
MKKIIPASLLFSLLFMLSCSNDFTSLAPHSERNVENFYKTPGDIEIAVNGIYDALQGGGTYGTTTEFATGGTGGYWVLTEIRSDNTDQGPDVTGLSLQVAVLNRFEEDALNEIPQGAWIESYQGIARANAVLTRIGDVDFGSRQDKDSFIGEALFLRSLFYYNLALLFGNIPMPLTETVSISEQPQVPAATVFAQLITDLTDAASKLPDVHPSTVGGRATSGAAQTLLAKVHLTVGDQASAETVLRAVISSGVFQLVPGYADLWGAANELNTESIFEVQFQAGRGDGSGYANTFAPDQSLVGGGTAGGRNRPTVDMITAYAPGDLRFEVSLDTMFVNPTGNRERYVRKYLSVPFGDFDGDNNWIVFRYADVLLMLAEAIGEGGEAYGLINQLRSRAGLADIDASTPGTFEDKLLQERRVELAFENHRWYDLLRFGKAQEVMQAHSSGATLDTFVDPAFTYTGQLLYAIPQREVDLGLDQN